MALVLTFTLMLFGMGTVNSARMALTLYALHLGAGPAAIGMLGAAMYAFPLVLSWPVGRLSDRLGSRWMLLFGALSGSCGVLIPYFARTLPALYAAAVLLGLMFSFYSVLLQNLVGLLSTPEKRARNYSSFGLCAAATSFLAPLYTGFAIDHSGHAAAFIYILVLALIAAALLVVRGGLLPGGTLRARRGISILATLAEPEVRRMLLTSALVQLGSDLFQFYIPVYGHNVGLSASTIGVVLATFAVASFVVRFCMPPLIGWLREPRLLQYSFAIAAASYLLVPLFTSPYLLGACAFLFGFGMGCGQPLTMMLMFSRSAPGRSGETLGLRMTTNSVMRVSGPALFGFIAAAIGLASVFWISAALMAAGAWFSRSAQPEGEP